MDAAVKATLDGHTAPIRDVCHVTRKGLFWRLIAGGWGVMHNTTHMFTHAPITNHTLTHHTHTHIHTYTHAHHTHTYTHAHHKNRCAASCDGISG